MLSSVEVVKVQSGATVSDLIRIFGQFQQAIHNGRWVNMNEVLIADGKTYFLIY